MRSYHSFAAACLLGIFVGFLPSVSHAACDQSRLGKVSFGSSGAAVSALQSCLIGAGYSIPAGVTGYYGAQTRSAVIVFYKNALGISWDGLSVGPQGRARLAAHAPGVMFGENTYKRAQSVTEFAAYVTESGKGQGGMRAFSAMGVEQSTDSVLNPTANSAQQRVSETNVQVGGIDEPDIIKTDGENLFISKQGGYGGVVRTLADDRMMAFAEPGMPIWQDTSKTLIVDAYPIDDLAVVSDKIEEKGDMLLVKDAHLLVTLSYPAIVGYDVTDPAHPEKKWSLTLGENTSLTTARLTGDTLYLVAQSSLTGGAPCPVVPLLRGTQKISIPCTDVWIPERIEPINTTYTVLAIDPKTGKEKRTLTVAVDGSASTVALFKDNLYLASKSYRAPYEVLIPTTIDAYAPYISAAALGKVRTIAGYDISLVGKLNEITQVIQTDMARQSPDERMRVETEAQNTVRLVLEEKKRMLDRTRIMRVSIPDLIIARTGEVPGTLLNQFSLDEYKGDLRVAVTVGSGFWWGGGETANDVYILGPDLAEKGGITDLGLGERVYAARFMGDTGYLVTFKQVDPFYVLDLSNPNAPKRAGELKIPGYSAYLEPLGGGLVLGVGREGNGVKLSIFDVTNPAKPVERSKYLIKDAWSEVESNHHAFLRDPDHSIFFIPGGNGGYVFSYTGGTLSLKATIAGWSVKRAVYIGNFLYVVGDEKITVLDEGTWKVARTLTL